MSGLPSGAVTFVFTDIEGSTRLVKALRERYVQVLAEHRRLVRAAIAGQGGCEVDTQGDAFFAAFAGAKQAVLCALEVQRALAAHDWPDGVPVRVRIGIHTGHAVPVEGAYTGVALTRAARICAAARGGQVLVSQATATIIEDEEEAAGFTLVDLGERTLKDLDRPVRLFELAVPGQAAAGSGLVWAGCPYLGLVPFAERDERVFYGRGELAGQLVQRLAGRLDGPGIVLVAGESGVGKSSLLRAGLMPRLAAGALGPGSGRWPRLVIRPGASPLRELAAELAEVAGTDPVSVYRSLLAAPQETPMLVELAVRTAAGRGPDRRSRGPGDAGAAGPPRLVLVVDQFEELFTAGGDEEAGRAEREAFIAALHAAASRPAGPRKVPAAVVVAAVRADFLGRLIAYPPLKAALDAGPFTVGPMSEAELRAAITGPAAEAGLAVEPAVVEAVTGELRDGAGGGLGGGVLPLMSQAMAATWEYREGSQLTLRGYRRAGGVADAVNRSAQAAYDTLTGPQQDAARQVFTQLTIITPDGQFARRRSARDDLRTGAAQPGDIDAVIDIFSAQRLLVLGPDSVEISHDALLQAWKQLRDWLADDQVDRVLYSQVLTDAATWDSSGRDSSYLYRGTQLAALQQAVTRWSANPARSLALTCIQRGFLQASERAAARSARRRRSALAILALLTALAVVAAGLAFFQRAAAIGQRDQAISNQVIAEALQYGTGDPSLAAQLYLAAYHIQPSPDAAARLLNTENTPLSSHLTGAVLEGFSNEPLSVAFKPHGHTLASDSADGTVRLWDVSDLAPPRLLGQPAASRPANANIGPNPVAFSPDGHTLASGGARQDGIPGVVRLWDVADPARPRLLSQLPADPLEYVDSVAFSPDGHTLASGSVFGVWLWDVTDPVHPRPLGPSLTGGTAGINSVAFSPDGHTLVSGDFRGRVRLWDVADLAHPRPLGQLPAGGTADVYSVALSPDGHTVASGSADGTVRLWDIGDPARPRPLGQPLAGGTADVNSVAFSPGGNTVAAGSGDGTIRLWDIADPARSLSLGQPPASGTAGISSVAFSPDGNTVASGSTDGTIRLWSLPQPLLTAGTAGIYSVAFSPHGHTLASGGFDAAVRLWDIADPAHPRPLGQHLAGTAGIYSVAFSADGHTLASGGDDGRVRLWDIADPAQPRPLGQPLADGTGGVNSVAFSPDGHTLASGSNDHTVRLWDIADPAQPRPLGQPLAGATAGIYSVAFSADGHTLASGSADGTVRLWDIADPAQPRPLGQPLAGGTGGVNSVSFSPGGHTLAAGSGDGTVRLWDVTDPAQPHPLGQPLAGGTGGVNSVSFSPGGHTLAAGSGDSTVRLWDVTDPAQPHPLGQPLAGGTGGVNSVSFSPDGQTLASGSQDGTVRLWDLNVQYAIQRICATAGGLTPRQWDQYIPQLQYEPACAH